MADGGGGGLCELFSDDHRDIRHVADADLFRILETWEECINGGAGGGGGGVSLAGVADQGAAAASTGAGGGARTTTTTTAANGRRREGPRRGERRRRWRWSSGTEEAKGVVVVVVVSGGVGGGGGDGDGAAKMSHITVERNRRKQMNEHLAVLRSLMPCFYVKRGDQASIIGGVVDYIKELQQVLRSLEAKKNRKAYADQVLSPRPSPAAAALMVKLHAADQPAVRRRRRRRGADQPTDAHPGQPVQQACRRRRHRSPAAPGGRDVVVLGGVQHVAGHDAHVVLVDDDDDDARALAGAGVPAHPRQPRHRARRPRRRQLQAAGHPSSAAAIAGIVGVPDVRVEFAGPNLVLKTVSHRAPGQALKIIAALESLSLEILHVSICTVDDATVLSFTIKIGIECELSAEELVQEIQQTFL
ncbi:hypothetical protein EE612_010197 [Oryza sativa]|nr:hypothetical protein EE612_010197 [Oryza sativa]